VISGATSVIGSQNFTITATGTTAGGASVTVSKQYQIVISDPVSFPFSVNLTIPASQLNSTLTDFPLLGIA
jgi:3D (Asp-Asp-Asp) domain-containing protein